MEPAKIALHLKGLKPVESTVMQINASTEKSFWRMVPVSNAHYTRKQIQQLAIVYRRTALAAVFCRRMAVAGGARSGLGRCLTGKHVELTALDNRK